MIRWVKRKGIFGGIKGVTGGQGEGGLTRK